MMRNSVLLGIASAGVVLLGVGCGPASLPPAPPPAVEVVDIEARRVQDFTIFTGRTEAVELVEVRSRVSGYLQEINFKDGQEVKVGQELFLIDPRPYQAEAERAEAELKAAQADLALAESEYARSKDLLAKQTISTQAHDVKTAALLRAQSQLGSAKATAHTAELNLEFTRIKAAIDGQISETTISIGNLITPQMELPLTTIVSTNPIYAYAEIDERQLLRFIRAFAAENPSREAPPDSDQPEKRTPVSMQLADEQDFPHQGVIDFSDNRVNPNTGTITLRAVFDDDQGILLPGYFVRLRLATSPEYEALVVPDQAIGTDQGQKFVYVVSAENKTDYRSVTLGTLQDDGWRVVQGNLEAGDRVIVEGMMKVRPGQEVDPRPWHRAEEVPTSPAAHPESDSAPAEVPPAPSSGSPTEGGE